MKVIQLDLFRVAASAKPKTISDIDPGNESEVDVNELLTHMRKVFRDLSKADSSDFRDWALNFIPSVGTFAHLYGYVSEKQVYWVNQITSQLYGSKALK